MKGSQKLKALAVLLVLAGLVLAFAWLIVSLAAGGGLLMNGPWLTSILALAAGASLAFASMVAEEREREAEAIRGEDDRG